MDKYIRIELSNINTVFVKKLLKENPNVNINDFFQFRTPWGTLHLTTLVYEAVRRNDKKLLDYLLNENVDLNLCSPNYGSALHKATENKNFELIKKLLKAGANINVKWNTDFSTPLVIASCRGDFEIAKYLIENGANINIVTSYCLLSGHTPIIIATRCRHKKIVELLLQNGADPCSEIGLTDLNVAGIQNILNTEPNININSFFICKKPLDHPPTTLAHLAVKFKNEELLDYLINSNADLNINIPKQGTVLQVPTELGDLNLVKKLIKFGANVNVSSNDINYETPLIIATKNGFFEMVEYLIEKGADVNFAGTSRQTALHFAVSKRYKEIIKLLLENNANPNAKGEYEATPLMSACRRGDFEIMKLLISHGGVYDSSVIRKVSLNKTPEVLDYVLSLDIDAIDKYLADDQPENPVLHHLSRYLPVLIFLKEADHCNTKTILDAGANINSVNNRNELAVEDFNTPKLIPSLDYVKQHIVKLQQAGIYMCSRNIESVKNGYENYRTNCNQEIEKLKSDKIGSSNSTFYDVLIRKFYSLVTRLMHTNIDNVVDKNKLSNAYPIYGGIIYYKLAKAQRRKELLENIEDFLDYVLNYRSKLPYTFTRELYMYLTNKDLKKLKQ